MNSINLKNGIGWSLLCALFATTGCSSDSGDAEESTKVDSRAIYTGIEYIHEMVVDNQNVYWSVVVDGDDTDDIGGVWSAAKDGSGTPVRLAKATEAESMIVVNDNVFYMDQEGENGLFRVPCNGGDVVNMDEPFYRKTAITSDGETLYGVADAKELYHESLTSYDEDTGKWSTIVDDAGIINNVVAAGDYLYMTLYAEDGSNSTLARVKKSGGEVEQLRQLDTKWGNLYASGDRLLLNLFGGEDGSAEGVVELDVDDGSVIASVDTNGCNRDDKWRNFEGHFYCYDGKDLRTFADEPTSESVQLVEDKLWNLAVDGKYVYWSGTATVSDNGLYVTSVYIGRQLL